MTSTNNVTTDPPQAANSPTPETLNDKTALDNTSNESESDLLSISSNHSDFYKDVFKTRYNEHIKNHSSILNFKNYFNYLNLEKHNDNDSQIPLFVCDICLKKGTDIILCDICYNSAHEQCLNDPNINGDDYICERCKFLDEQLLLDAVPCYYCNQTKGLMKKLDNGAYAHYYCDKYLKGEFVKRNCLCCVCNKKQPFGLQCQFDGCDKVFDVKCGFVKYKQVVYCKEHLIKVDKILLLNKKRKKSNENKNNGDNCSTKNNKNDDNKE